MNIGKVDQALSNLKAKIKDSPIMSTWKQYEYAPDLIDHLREKNINVKTLPPELSEKWAEKTGLSSMTGVFFIPQGIDLNKVEDNPEAETFLKSLDPNAGPRDYINSMRLARKYMDAGTGGTIYYPEHMLVEDTNYEGMDHYGYGREIRKKIADVLTETNIVNEALANPVRSLGKFTVQGREGFRDPKKEGEYLESIGITPSGDLLGADLETEEELWRRLGKGEDFDEKRRTNIEVFGEEAMGL